ncbi:MAG: CvpA family protein [Agathobacter sp.]|nr:CvpA family protein [Agathobacter sp.]
MNILLIIVLAVFAIFVFKGYKKGFLKTAFSLVSWILILILCNFATPMVTAALIEHTPIDEAVQTTVDAKVGEIIAETLESSSIAELEATLPAELKALILGENESLQDVIANGALDTSVLVSGVVNIFGFIVTVIVLRVIMSLIEIVLTIVGKLPLIGPLDKLLGLACGAGEGLIWCWLLLAAVSLMALTGVNTEFAAYISQSELLTWLQDNNLLLNLILNMK